jgi:hypothetical protein
MRITARLRLVGPYRTVAERTVEFVDARVDSFLFQFRTLGGNRIVSRRSARCEVIICNGKRTAVFSQALIVADPSILGSSCRSSLLQAGIWK